MIGPLALSRSTSRGFSASRGLSRHLSQFWRYLHGTQRCATGIRFLPVGSTSIPPMRHAVHPATAQMCTRLVRYRTRRDQIDILSFRHGLGTGGTRIISDAARSSVVRTMRLAKACSNSRSR